MFFLRKWQFVETETFCKNLSVLMKLSSTGFLRSRIELLGKKRAPWLANSSEHSPVMWEIQLEVPALPDSGLGLEASSFASQASALTQRLLAILKGWFVFCFCENFQRSQFCSNVEQNKFQTLESFHEIKGLFSSQPHSPLPPRPTAKTSPGTPYYFSSPSYWWPVNKTNLSSVFQKSVSHSNTHLLFFVSCV